jgi:hypothetical protein
MSQQVVNVGTAANDGTGDPLRTAMTKLNANDADLYANVALKIPLTYLDADTTLAGNSDIKLATQKAAKAYVDARLARGHVYGLTLSTAGASATFGVAIGMAIDSTFVDVLLLSTAFTKTASAWAVGTGNGSLDTGAIANSTSYHVHIIKRPDTGLVDILTSLSPTAPTLPANYTLFRRVGSMRTNGSGQWIKFIQDGRRFILDVPVLDVNATNPGTAAVLRTMSVPTGINVTWLGHARASTITASSAVATLFTDPAQADTTPDFNLSQQIGNTSISPYAELQVRTNTSGQIRSRCSFSDVNVALVMVTEGWIDGLGDH